MSLYEKVLDTAKPFLGWRTEIFIRRQCERHLNIAPEDLGKEHIPQLAYWVSMSAALIISRQQVDLLEQKILTLGQK
jgi:hypothetical protein